MSASVAMKRIRAATAALILLCVGFLAYNLFFKQAGQSLMSELQMGEPFNLIDHIGNPITEAALSGNPSAVFFGFTHCPEVCPTSLYDLSGWLDELGEEGKHINAFFISLDPERDKPEVIKSYVENFTDRIVGVTGDPTKVTKLAKSWRVYWKKVPLEDDDYTMDHTASIFLIDANGNFKGTIAFQEDSETAVQKLRNLAKG